MNAFDLFCIDLSDADLVALARAAYSECVSRAGCLSAAIGQLSPVVGDPFPSSVPAGVVSVPKRTRAAAGSGVPIPSHVVASVENGVDAWGWPVNPWSSGLPMGAKRAGNGLATMPKPIPRLKGKALDACLQRIGKHAAKLNSRDMARRDMPVLVQHARGKVA